MSGVRVGSFALFRALIFAIALLFLLHIGLCVPGRVLYRAPGLLRFALYLLCCALCLGVRVASPLSHLALCSPRGVVHCTLHPVLIHNSTSVDCNLADRTFVSPATWRDERC